jgi:hypothetical protein
MIHTDSSLIDVRDPLRSLLALEGTNSTIDKVHVDSTNISLNLSTPL